MKKMWIALLAVAALLSMAACGEQRTVSCDRCGTDIRVEKDSNITDDWIVFCEDCEAEIGPIVEPG